MTALRVTAIASALVATTVAAALAASAGAETARERPTGVVASPPHYGLRSLAVRQFDLPWNLVVEPLAIERGAVPAGYHDGAKGEKFPVYVRAGHRVTLELSRRTRQGAGLAYGPLPEGEVGVREANRVVTFVAYRGHLTVWFGAVVADSPRCVPLLVWVDDKPSPRRAVIRLGVRRCT